MLKSLFDNIILVVNSIGAGVILFGRAIGGFRFTKANITRCFEQMASVGVDSLLIVVMTMAFIGMVFGLQLTSIFVQFGAGSLVGSVFAVALARELMPIFIGIVVAARIGAAFAAELGTMKITNQIEALKTLATDPVSYLVTPRLYASMIMLPILGCVGMVVAMIGAGYISSLNGVSYSAFMESASTFLPAYDFIGGIVKTAIFGMVITITSCYIGINTDGGAKGVGKSTTNAVVWSIVLIFAFNFLLSYILIKLDIII